MIAFLILGAIQTTWPSVAHPMPHVSSHPNPVAARSSRAVALSTEIGPSFLGAHQSHTHNPKKGDDMTGIYEAEQDVYRAREHAAAAARRVKEAEQVWDTLVQQASGALPKAPGWYVDANECIWRLNGDNTWDDGWGNSGPEYGGFPEAPLKHLVEASDD